MDARHASGLRRLALFLLLAWVLPAVACNLPTAPTPGPGAPLPGVEQAVQQTLAAQQFLTAQPGQTLAPPAAETPLPGLPIVTPGATISVLTGDVFQYTTRPGDTIEALAGRFGVTPEQILDPQLYSPRAMLPSGQVLAIPNVLGEQRFSGALLPDSEVVYSPAVDFDLNEFIQQAGGYLSVHSEQVEEETLSGAEIVRRVAQETSINPRLLLAVLEYRAGWVFGMPERPNTANPIGFYARDFNGLHKELTLVARQLTLGYYGWRSGTLAELEFVDKSRLRINPHVNPGTVALQYLFTKLYLPPDWQEELYDPGRFLAFYQQRFGDPWQRAAVAGPVLPDGLTQPLLELPFSPGEQWTLTGGPHIAWGVGSPWGGLDFAPANVEAGCGVSRFWTTAAAPGYVVRAERGMVVIDLDGDGREQTGWVLLYMHVAAEDRVPAGTMVAVDQRIGHPSCEGGNSTGTHVHLSRKYNGEWLPAESPIPFVLSGWTAFAGTRQYSGSLVNGDTVVTSRPDGTRTSLISR